jgi:hypothetical protein
MVDDCTATSSPTCGEGSLETTLTLWVCSRSVPLLNSIVEGGTKNHTTEMAMENTTRINTAKAVFVMLENSYQTLTWSYTWIVANASPLSVEVTAIGPLRRTRAKA